MNRQKSSHEAANAAPFPGTLGSSTLDSQAPKSSYRERLRPVSTLLALAILMVMFELAGRVWNPDASSAFGAWTSGSGSFQAFLSAVAEGVFSNEMAFLSPRNMTNLSLQVSINGILAVGMTFVILTGGIDLSVGSVVALCGIALGLAQVKLGFGVLPSLAIAMAVGTAIGLTNGVMIAKYRIPPFVITLGFLVIARGLALILSDSSAISPLGDGVRWMGAGFLPAWVAGGLLALGLAATFTMRRAERSLDTLPVLIAGTLLALLITSFGLDRGMPVPTLALFLAAALGIFLLSSTTLGRAIYAVGGNETAALLSGLKVHRVKILVYTTMGLLAGLAATILAGRLNSATPTEGQLMELDAIAAVVIGGTSLQGGIGKIQGSIIGAFIIGVLNNGMDMLELSTDYQMVMKGLIIVFAVWSDSRAQTAPFRFT